MNRTKLKNYAPKARRDFIQAMTDRAAYYGLTANKVEPVVERGDVAVIAGREHPRVVAEKRKALEDRIKRHGFGPTMEAMAYTWFNRLVAIRFMELHGYLDHGYRVLSHPEGKLTPEILEHAEHVDISGLKKETVIDLKLAGNKEGELYRLLLTAQCNALHAAMPFLFEKIDDETELLLPDNLLHSDSLIRKLVGEIDEEDWQQVEIIGWLYQFYISEKKDEVIGKVVASEDIPAATQLFTPNWIVKYLVQNTLGRQWLATYPQSALRQQMQYYIEPAEQTSEVQEQLKAITPTSLNPEELTLLDSACGSGHILVEAYDLFKAIYQERGYRARDIPALILQKNLFGLEIDDRAAQLASFALMMKARADDRRIFDSEAKPNILAFQDSQGLNAADITYALNAPINKEDLPKEYLFEEMQEEKDGLFSKKALAEKGHVSQGDIASLLELFENAKTFGSLIQVPPQLAATLPEIEKRLDDVLKRGDLTHASAHVIKPLLQQARLLAKQYDTVVANPPYMGSKYHCTILKRFVEAFYKAGRADLYGAFTLRNVQMAKSSGYISMITFTSWMFLSSFEQLRMQIFEDAPISMLVHNGRGVWGSDFGTCAYVLQRSAPKSLHGRFLRLFEKQGSVASNDELERRFHENPRFDANADDFNKIPGSPVAYWLSNAVRAAFGHAPLERITISEGQNKTADNDRFVRLGWEVDSRTVGQGRKWLSYAKGGAFRKWFGNLEHVVDWSELARAHYRKDFSCRIIHESLWYEPGISWTLLAYDQSFRYLPEAATFDMTGSSVFFKDSNNIEPVLGFLNSKVCSYLTNITNPTVALQIKNVRDLPIAFSMTGTAASNAKRCVAISKIDYCAYETAFEFNALPLLLLSLNTSSTTIKASYNAWISQNRETITEMKSLEEDNNRFFIEAYGLTGEITPDVSNEKITLTVNPAYRYGGKLTEEEQWTRFRQDTMRELISYAIGCMMGRYSLDAPGLIYANAGNVGFDVTRYKTFPADADGILPLTDELWFRGDASSRIREFLLAVWGAETLVENMVWLAESLGAKTSETPEETIRRYLADKFFKDHLQTYKKRPIYWLFSSGKQRAFQCLVYLHRYHEGTLARVRTEYVIPLQGQITARIEQLEGDKAKATSTSHRNKLQKEQNDLKKQQAELFTFEEKLKHAADQKISLDLDDGVKVNYGKFGDLLAESKVITGGKDDE